MAKVFQFDTTYGLVDKVSGTALTFSGITFKITSKGLATYYISGSNGYIRKNALLVDYNSILINFHITSTVANNLGSFGTDANSFIYLGNASGLYADETISIYSGGSYQITYIKDALNMGWNQLILSWNGSSYDFYLNGIKRTTYLYSEHCRIFNGNINIGSSPLNNCNGMIQKDVKIYSNSLTQKEVETEYKQFLQLQPLLEKKTNFFYAKPTELRETGLIGAWNMKPNGSTLVDISGNGNNGTLVGGIATTKDGLKFDGTSGYVSLPFANITGKTTGTIMGIFKTLTAGYIWTLTDKDVNNNYVYLYLGEDTGSVANESIGIHVRKDGSSLLQMYTTEGNTAYTDGKWHTFTVVVDGIDNCIWIDGIKKTMSFLNGNATTSALTNITGTDNSSLGVLRYNSTIVYSINEQQDFRFYSSIKTPIQIKNYHNNFIRKIILKETFAYDKADGTTTIPTGWVPGTGSYKLMTEPTGNSIIKKGQKYLECTSTGHISIPSKQAYGTWEFSLKPLNGASILFISDRRSVFSDATSTKYVLFFSTTSISFYRKQGPTGAVLFTASLSGTTLYRFKITRTALGVFSFYIKGGSFGNKYILMTATGGTNPVTNNVTTTSNFFSFGGVTGSILSDVVFKQGIEV